MHTDLNHLINTFILR